MHIYRLLLLSLLVGLSNISVAQYSVEVKVESRQTDAPPEHVYLYAQEGNNLKRLRALPYPSSKRFTIKQIDHMGLYWIGTSPATLYPIMLGKDQQVSGEMRFEDGVNEFTFDHADQNAYKAFMLRKKEFEAAYKELNTEYTLKLRSLKTQEAKHTYQVEIMQRTDEMARNYNKDLKQMAKDHPGTYTADYLAPIAHTHIPDRSKDSGEQMQERKTMFFSGVDFTDPNIIYNAYLHLKLFQFFNENRSPQMGGFTGAIDYVMKRQALHPKVANFMANYFIEAFGLRGPDQALQYVVEEYGDMITDTTMGVKLVLEREENLKPGKPALEMAYPDTSGNMRKLRDNLGEPIHAVVHLVEHLWALYRNPAHHRKSLYGLRRPGAKRVWRGHRPRPRPMAERHAQAPVAVGECH